MIQSVSALPGRQSPRPHPMATAGKLLGLCTLGAVLIPACAGNAAGKGAGAGGSAAGGEKLIFGRVVDANGKPVANVRVSTDPPTSEMTTSADGEFRFSFAETDDGKKAPIPQGKYSVLAVKLGFQTKKIQVTYSGSPMHTEDIIMMEEEISYQDSGPLGRTQSSAGGGSGGQIKKE